MMMYTPKHRGQTAALGKYGVVTTTQDPRAPCHAWGWANHLPCCKPKAEQQPAQVTARAS